MHIPKNVENTGQEKVPLLRMCWVFVHPKCYLSMFFWIGKALHMMSVSFAMLFLGHMALEFLEVIYIFKRNYIVNKTHFNRPILTNLKVIIIWLVGGIQIVRVFLLHIAGNDIILRNGQINNRKLLKSITIWNMLKQEM